MGKAHHQHVHIPETTTKKDSPMTSHHQKKFIKTTHPTLIATLLCLTMLTTVIPTQAFTTPTHTYTLTFDPHTLTITTTNDITTLTFPDATNTGTPGTPTLPSRTLQIAIPATTTITAVHILAATTQPLPGTFTLPAMQPPQTTDTTPTPINIPSTTIPSDPYPATPIQLLGQSDLYGQGLITLRFTPLQYHPNSNTLTVITSITIQLVGIPGRHPGDYLPTITTARDRQEKTQTIQRLVINPDDVHLITPPSPIAPLGLPSGGPYSFVIITSTTDATAWQSLADWHTKRGLRTTIVNTTYIYANYAGSSNEAKIRNFIIDAYNTWSCSFFLLGGETSSVPSKSKTYTIDWTQYTVWGDQYYTDFDDDWASEVNVGRVSAEGSSQVILFTNKVLTYETNPPLTNYATKALLQGMDLDSSSPAEDFKENDINNTYIPSEFTVSTVYDSQPYSPTHRTKFINALNAGQNLVNHADHSNQEVMGMGYVNHDDLLDISDVDALTNTGKLCNIISLGCDPNDMNDEDSISEHFVLYNTNKAAVSFTGDTGYGWYQTGDPGALTGTLDKGCWQAIFSNNKYTLGEMISQAKNNYGTPSQSVEKYCFYSFELLGDPAMTLWTDNPSTLAVTHPSTLPTGSSTFTVHVTSGSSPVNQALVCLWKGTEVYLTATTNSQGNATFTPAPTTIGTMNVTVTKQNYLPNVTTANVTTGNIPPEAFDDTATVTEGSSNNLINVLANDHDDNQDPLTIQSVTQPAHGQSSTNGAYAYYTPTTGYYGTDSFTYTISDGHGGTDTATVSLTVLSNDIPPVATDDFATTNEDTPLWVLALANDYDPDGTLVPSSVTVISAPAHGATSVNTTTGAILYSPETDYHGADSFIYQVSDNEGATDLATVSMTTLSINDPPIASFTYEPTLPQINQLIYFNSTSYDVDNAIVNWTWDFGDGTTSYREYETHSYTLVQSYTVTLTVRDELGATGTVTMIVTSHPPPLEVNDGGPYSGMQGCLVQFTGNATGGLPPYSYEWRFGDGSTSDEQNPTHTYHSSDVFIVNFQVTDSLGDSVMAMTTTNISSDSIPPSISLVTPAPNMLYVFGRPILPLSRTVVIGPVTVIVHALDDQTGVDHVEFYVNDGLLAYTSVGPEYQWQWSVLNFGSATLKVVAIDKAGNSKSAQLNLVKIF